MLYSIDWLTVVLPIKNLFTDDIENGVRINDLIYHQPDRDMADFIVFHNDLQRGLGRWPYTKSYHSPSGGFTYFCESEESHSTIEFTGKGCETLRTFGVLESVMDIYQDRVSRVDLAVDIETDLHPLRFAKKRWHKRFKHLPTHPSDSGFSVDVGSPKSDRHATVYRFFAPHPRSHLLRVEHKNRGHYAKAVTKAVVNYGLPGVARQLGEAYGWDHPCWQPDAESTPLEISAPKVRNKSMSNTEFWLSKQSLPALRKVYLKGGDEFVRWYISQCQEILSGE